MKNILKNLGLLAVSLAISLLLGEILVRLIAPQQLIVPSHDIWRPDETIGWRHRENANAQINTGEGTVHFVSDENGYRINSIAEDEANAEPDISIITIGDSFLEAVQVENRFTIPQVIRRILSNKYDKKVKVVNDGVGAWNPNHYLAEAKLALAKGRYDLGIIFLYSANDIIIRKQTSFSSQVVSGKHHFRLPRSLKWRELINSIFYPINDLLEENSHLFLLLKNRTQALRARVGLAADSYFPPVYKISEKNSERWEVTTEICEEIQQVFARHMTPVFFVILPAPFQINVDSFYESLDIYDIISDSVDIDQPNTIMRDMFQSESLHLEDPLMHMRKIAEEGRLMYGEVDGHFNAYGHEVVAEYIIDEIEEYLTPLLRQ